MKIQEFLAESDGSGDGCGCGDGYGFKSFDGKAVYMVDGLPTIIDAVRGNIARGRLLRTDLQLTPCYIVKQGSLFAHGNTLHAARDALLDKMFDDMPVEERIAEFMKTHKLKTEYPNSDFFSWHHRLTGSCEMGRNEFAKEHGVDLTASMTTEQFLDLTKNAYGGDIIRRVITMYA